MKPGGIWVVSHTCHQLACKRCGEPLLTGVVFSNWSNWSSPSRPLQLVFPNSSPPTGPTGLRSVWRSALVFSKSSSSPSRPLQGVYSNCLLQLVQLVQMDSDLFGVRHWSSPSRFLLQVVLSKASTPTVSSNWSNWSPIRVVLVFSNSSSPTETAE